MITFTSTKEVPKNMKSSLEGLLVKRSPNSSLLISKSIEEFVRAMFKIMKQSTTLEKESTFDSMDVLHATKWTDKTDIIYNFTQKFRNEKFL